MKVTVAIDSFKGSMTSIEAGNAVRDGLLDLYPDASVVVYPVADGGEGTVEALSYSADSVNKRRATVTGPLGDKIDAEYTIIEAALTQHEHSNARQIDIPNKTAIIEMSSAAGLPLVPVDKRNPMHTTTYGVGELILDAIKQGCRNFIIGIGGSATNDGGIGMLQALGYHFVDAKGNDVSHGAEGLSKLADIYFEDAIPELLECRFRVACDVDNPLVGTQGCSAVFAPQKGADEEMVQNMEQYMKQYANLVEHIAMCDMGPLRGGFDRHYPGTGAAGGLGYAFLMFLNAKLERGVEIILDELGIENDIADSDIVITGEGKLDLQTLSGKTPAGVARLAKKYGRKVVAFAGMLGEGAEECLQSGLIDECYQIERGDMDLETAMVTENAINNLRNTVSNVL